MYVSVGMYGLETEVITLHACWRRRPPCRGLLQKPSRLPALPNQGRELLRGPSVWKHRASFWCLGPRSRSLVPSLSKDPLFNMFTMAALKPHCFSVFALSFISFPLLQLAQDVSTVLMIMSSVWCVHGEKKTKHKRY